MTRESHAEDQQLLVRRGRAGLGNIRGGGQSPLRKTEREGIGEGGHSLMGAPKDTVLWGRERGGRFSRLRIELKGGWPNSRKGKPASNPSSNGFQGNGLTLASVILQDANKKGNC